MKLAAGHPFENEHGTGTNGTTQLGGNLGMSCTVDQAEQSTAACEHAATPAVCEKAEVADADQALGQNVDQEAAQELICGDRHDLLLAAMRIVAVHVDCEDGPPDVLGTHVLLAVGRIPNTSDLGLDKAGVATDDRGYIIVDDQLQTNVSGIWALGDCNGRGAFTHTSYNDYEIVADNLFNADHRSVSDRILA